jgi:hypothetical protein
LFDGVDFGLYFVACGWCGHLHGVSVFDIGNCGIVVYCSDSVGFKTKCSGSARGGTTFAST